MSRSFGPVPITDDKGNDMGQEAQGVVSGSRRELHEEIARMQVEGFSVGRPPELDRHGMWTAVMVRTRGGLDD